MPRNTVHPAELINSPRISPLQYLVFVMCALSVFIDGFDTQALAYIAPVLAKNWSLRPGALGPVFAAGLLGSALGSSLLAPLSDRFGRKRIMVWSAAFIGACTLLCSRATSLTELQALRCLTGLGLGATLPNSLALIAEYAPESRRVSVITISFCGLALGAASGAVVGNSLVPQFGWSVVFVVGGVATLALCPLLLWLLPESLLFLSLHAPRSREAQAIVRRLRPDHAAQEAELLPEFRKPAASAVSQLFRDGRGTVNMVFATLSFLTLLELYLLTSWLPTLINNLGYSLAQASWATAGFQLGGITGSICLGMLVDRLGALRIVPTAYVIAALWIGVIATGNSLAITCLAAFGAGFTVVGAQACNNAVLASLNPTSSRATALGLNLTVGRIGSILGPTITGVLLSMNVSAQHVLLWATLPIIVAALLMRLSGGAIRRATQPVTSIATSPVRAE